MTILEAEVGKAERLIACHLGVRRLLRTITSGPQLLLDDQATASRIVADLLNHGWNPPAKEAL